MNSRNLAALVQEKLRAGQLPREACHEHGSAGPDLGSACAVCDNQIFDVARWCKLRSGAIFWFHADCFDAWATAVGQG